MLDDRQDAARIVTTAAFFAATMLPPISALRTIVADHLGAAAYRDLRAALLKLREVTDPYR